jgi:serine/threonine protein kinase
MTGSDPTSPLPIHDALIGRVFADRYRIVARIGAGGMGVVYRAWDLVHDHYVVIKIPRRELIGDARFLERFSRELAALRSLVHPGIVPIVDFGYDDSLPFAVMPYLAGGSLKTRRTTRGGQRLPGDAVDLWRWLPQVAAALDFVHAQGFVHRDVKPDNVLFDGQGQPFLGDFGVAKVVYQSEHEAATHGLTGTGFAVGTPAYMAPETVSGAKPTGAFDQYSLAVMVYEWLAGRQPFQGPTPAAILVAHVAGNPPALETLCPALDSRIAAAVGRGMSRDPATRFSTCSDLARAVLTVIPAPPPLAKMQLMCPSCGRMLTVRPDWAGRQGSCPKCKSPLVIAADLHSLWLPSDRNAPGPSDPPHIGQLGGTPSRPVPLPTVSDRPRAPKRGSRTLLIPAVAISCLLLGVMATLSLVSRPLPAPGRSVPSRDDSATVAETTPREEPAATTTSLRAHEEPPRAPDAHEEDGTRDAPRLALQSPAQSAAPLPDPIPDESSLDESSTVAQATESVATSSPTHEVGRGADSAPPRERSDPPPEDAIARGLDLIREAYADEYPQAEKTGNFMPLIEALRDALAQTPFNKSAQRCALLREMRDLSIRGGSLPEAMRTIRDTEQEFLIDGDEERLALLRGFAARKDLSAMDLYEQAAGLTSSALAMDDMTLAQAAAALALKTAQSLEQELRSQARMMQQAKVPAPLTTGAERRVEEATRLLERVRWRAKRYADFRDSQEHLERDASDPTAHRIVGEYLCFCREAWDQGLPHLARGNASVLADLAVRHAEVMAMPREEQSPPLLALANAWWDLTDEPASSELGPFEQEAVRGFAGKIYGDLTPEIRDPLERRIAGQRATQAAATPVSRVAGRSGNVPPQPPATLENLLPGNESPNATATLTPAFGMTTGTAAARPATASSTRKGTRGRDNAFAARLDSDLQKQLLQTGGGNERTEAAVEAGLTWLLSHQFNDGGWSYDHAACPGCGGQCTQGGDSQRATDRGSATGLALLAFAGKGYTHRHGPYKRELERAVTFLGSLATSGAGKCYGPGGSLYSQGVATIALAELFALTKDGRLKAPTQAAITFIGNAQHEQGGWRYSPGQPGDTSATGWQISALNTGYAAGFEFNPLCVKRALQFLVSVQEDDGAAYGYTSPGRSPGTTAVGLLCQLHLGATADAVWMQRGADSLVKRGPMSDLYFTYYATQVLRRVNHASWPEWNEKLQKLLLPKQAIEGHATGSWYDGVSGGFGAHAGGRLYCTTLSILILESYYRHVTPEMLRGLERQ